MRNILFCCIAVSQLVGAKDLLESFRYVTEVSGAAKSLTLTPPAITPGSCSISLNGGDTRQPNSPFTFLWGDGTVTSGFFPQNKTYTSCTSNYTIEVRPNYGSGPVDGASITVLFAPLSPVGRTVDVSGSPVELLSTIPSFSTRLYSPPGALVPITPARIGGVARADIEYILSAASKVQLDFVNQNAYPLTRPYRQVVAGQNSIAAGVLYSVWFTDPIAFVWGSPGESVPWSSFFHEMGHNVTLNVPAAFYHGGRIDGNANAIFSEALAQIFQHATAYELLTRHKDYGIPLDIGGVIAESAHSSAWLVRSTYDSYVAGGATFRSWNDPATQNDETFQTFMTVAYVFLEQAEADNTGYRLPTKRMMEFFSLWNQDLATRYAQGTNSTQADAFRATYMVTALSHAFQRDLRARFRQLNFPVDDTIYDDLTGAARAVTTSLAGPVLPFEGGLGEVSSSIAAGTGPWTARSGATWLQTVSGTATRVATGTAYTATPNTGQVARQGSIRVGSQTVNVSQQGVPAGSTPLPLTPSPASGSTSAALISYSFHDNNGASDLDVVNILINNFLDGRNGCYLAYSRPFNVLYLVNDAGTALQPGLVLNGTGGVTSNSQCGVDAGQSYVVSNGTTLTLHLFMTFTASFSGNKVIYLAARDAAANNSGWRPLGVWTAPGSGAAPAIELPSLTPAAGGSGTYTFQLKTRNIAGATDFDVINLLVNSALDGAGACYIAYSRALNVLYLVNDAGDGLLPGLVLNGTGATQNTQCGVSGTGSSAVISGNELTLTLRLTFGAGFAGNRVLYGAARGTTQGNSGWKAMGTWIVPR